jgi:hypothetical protein
MDQESSYFARTNWFIWIGFTTSLAAFIFMAYVGIPAQENSNLQISPPQTTYILMTIVCLVLSFIIERRLKREPRAATVTVWYTLRLLVHEVVAATTFIVGFQFQNFDFMLPYVGLIFIMNFVAIPSRLPKV